MNWLIDYALTWQLSDGVFEPWLLQNKVLFAKILFRMTVKEQKP